MTCDNCGYANLPQAGFCTLCGTALEQGAYTNQTTRRTKSMPWGKKGQTPKKPGAVRAVMIAAGAVTLIACVLICILIFAGTPVTGGWYSERSNTALVFAEDGSVMLFSLAGKEEGKYSYNRLEGQGSIYPGQSKAFKVDKDGLIYDASETFKRAQEGFDAEDFVKSALCGYWSNKELAEVFEIRDGKTAIIHTVHGDEGAAYDYDVAEGEGVINYGGAQASFTASTQQIEVSGAGTFVKESEGFDIEAFLEEYGNPLKGAWYDKAGSMGRFDFLKEGAFTLLSYGTIYEGSYRFENKEAEGSLTVNGSILGIRLNGETLSIGQWEFTREAGAQKGKDSIFEQLAGIWYDEAGISGTLEFFMNGTAAIKSADEEQAANCAFDPITGQGIITQNAAARGQKAFHISDGKLALGGTLYTKDFIEQHKGSLTGVWRHAGGTWGTIRFLSGGKAELELAGAKYTGTYTFDDAKAAGTVTAVYGGREWTFAIWLEGGNLVVETGLFIAGDVTYTRDDVNKPSP